MIDFEQHNFKEVIVFLCPIQSFHVFEPRRSNESVIAFDLRVRARTVIYSKGTDFK